MSNVILDFFGMFDKVDDIIYEPIKMVCDALRQPLKQPKKSALNKIFYKIKLPRQGRSFERQFLFLLKSLCKTVISLPCMALIQQELYRHQNRHEYLSRLALISPD
jgi:hypothetical protein